MIVLGPGRDKDLDITPESIKKRMDKNKKLHEPVEKVAVFLAEGQGMADGLNFMTGADLAGWMQEAIMFSISTLQEQGWISKQLPKKAKEKSDETDDYGQYL